MDKNTILYPMLGQVLLTVVVWVWMYITRLGTMMRLHISPQELADPKGKARLQGVAGPSDNLSNLFETPLLFYVALLTIYVTNQVDQVFSLLAWSFVLLRCLHSFIHCSNNRVLHRFVAYLLSSLILFIIWARIALALLSV